MKIAADLLPIGSEIIVGDTQTSEGRILNADFQKYLFAYFEELNSGQTGWGMDFLGWLSVTKGWVYKGIGKGLQRFVKEQALEEEE